MSEGWNVEVLAGQSQTMTGNVRHELHAAELRVVTDPPCAAVEVTMRCGVRRLVWNVHGVLCGRIRLGRLMPGFPWEVELRNVSEATAQVYGALVDACEIPATVELEPPEGFVLWLDGKPTEGRVAVLPGQQIEFKPTALQLGRGFERAKRRIDEIKAGARAAEVGDVIAGMRPLELVRRLVDAHDTPEDEDGQAWESPQWEEP